MPDQPLKTSPVHCNPLAAAVACLFALMLAVSLSACGSASTQQTVETFTAEVTLTGGSGRASIASPATLKNSGDSYTATIVWSSSNYDKMTVGGKDYAPVTLDGGSTFEIPVVLDEDIPVAAETLAMSTPHTIEYTLRFDSSTLAPLGENSAANSSSGEAVQGDEQAADFRNTDLGCGWKPSGSAQLAHAKLFSIDTYQGGYKLICITGGERFLVVPAGKKAPSGLAADIAVIEQPADKAYLVSSALMCLVDAIGANDKIAMSGTKAEDCSVAGFKKKLESGKIAYGGKYSAPDYEAIAAAGCGLAIENTMINHTPDVKQKLQDLGLVVLTEHSSAEAEVLGRIEWVKLLGAVFGEEKAANKLYKQQEQRINQLQGDAPTGKTVAFFYISSNGAAITRKSGDYIAQMIGIAGGNYILDGTEEGQVSSNSSVTLEMERFFAAAKDADVIVYNSTIDNSVSSLQDLLAKNSLLSEFKAVREGQVYITSADMYQQMTSTAAIIEELHGVLSGSPKASPQFIEKLS